MGTPHPTSTQAERAAVGSCRPRMQFETTCRKGVVLLWHACGKNIEVTSGRIDDALLASHVCGPHGSPWDRKH